MILIFLFLLVLQIVMNILVVELQLSAPSSQTSLTAVNAAVGNPGAFNEPVEETSGFKQIVPLQFEIEMVQNK